MSRGWIAVDFDGTLAQYDGWKSEEILGEPIPKMLERVKNWLAEGKTVKIFTARVGASNIVNKDGQRDDAAFAERQRAYIRAWCLKHIGQELEVTAVKDLQMIELWDDRAVGVETNTGEIRTHERTRENWKFED